MILNDTSPTLAMLRASRNADIVLFFAVITTRCQRGPTLHLLARADPHL